MLILEEKILSKEIEGETYEEIQDRDEFETYVHGAIKDTFEKQEWADICEDLSKECDIFIDCESSFTAFKAPENRVLRLPNAMVEVKAGNYILVGDGVVFVLTRQQLTRNFKVTFQDVV